MAKNKAGIVSAVVVSLALLLIFGGTKTETNKSTRSEAVSAKTSISTGQQTAKPANIKRTEAAQKQQTEATVYISSQKSKVYHSKKTCSGMKNPRRITLKEAQEQGKRPCKKCY